MLLSGQGEILGLREEEKPSFVIRDLEDGLVYIVGWPAEGAIREAVVRSGGGGIVIAQREAIPQVNAALPGWKLTRATLHLLGDAGRLPNVPAGSVRLLGTLDSLARLPPQLRSELRTVTCRSPIAVGLESDRIVSFCYVAARTESLWDISIDTLEGFRRRGHAARCVAFMVRLMSEEGLQPVWGAEEWNRASLGLAASLGFSPVDEYVVLRPAGSPWRTSATTTGNLTGFT